MTIVTTGDVSECTVMYKLTKLGFKVFVPVGSAAVGFDLIAVVDSKLVRVSVRTMSCDKNGCFLASLTRSNGRKHSTIASTEYDFLVGVDKASLDCFVWAASELVGLTRAVAASSQAKEAWHKLPL